MSHDPDDRAGLVAVLLLAVPMAVLLVLAALGYDLPETGAPPPLMGGR